MHTNMIAVTIQYKFFHIKLKATKQELQPLYGKKQMNFLSNPILHAHQDDNSIKTWKITSVGEAVEKVNPSYIAGGNVKGAATMENS